MVHYKLERRVFGMKPCGMKLFGHFQQLKQRKVMGDLFIGGSLKTKVPR